MCIDDYIIIVYWKVVNAAYNFPTPANKTKYVCCVQQPNEKRFFMKIAFKWVAYTPNNFPSEKLGRTTFSKLLNYFMLQYLRN